MNHLINQQFDHTGIYEKEPIKLTVIHDNPIDYISKAESVSCIYNHILRERFSVAEYNLHRCVEAEVVMQTKSINLITRSGYRLEIIDEVDFDGEIFFQGKCVNPDENTPWYVKNPIFY